MRPWASSGGIKIKRANAHIRDLEGQIAAFVDRRPYVATPDVDDDFDDPEIKRYGHQFIVTERERLPDDWPAVVADAVHNMHVALDHLWQRVTRKSSVRKNYFPVRENPEAAEPLLKRKEKSGVHPAVQLLFDVNAFEVGNPFWRIREFDDTDKHDTLTLVACYAGRLTINSKRMGGIPIPVNWSYVPRDRGDAPERVIFPPLEDGAIIYAYPFEPKLDVDVELTPVIAFGEGGLMQGELVVPTLQNLLTSVDSLASAFIAAGLLK